MPCRPVSALVFALVSRRTHTFSRRHICSSKPFTSFSTFSKLSFPCCEMTRNSASETYLCLQRHLHKLPPTIAFTLESRHTFETRENQPPSLRNGLTTSISSHFNPFCIAAGYPFVLAHVVKVLSSVRNNHRSVSSLKALCVTSKCLS